MRINIIIQVKAANDSIAVRAAVALNNEKLKNLRKGEGKASRKQSVLLDFYKVGNSEINKAGSRSKQAVTTSISSSEILTEFENSQLKSGVTGAGKRSRSSKIAVDTSGSGSESGGGDGSAHADKASPSRKTKVAANMGGLAPIDESSALGGSSSGGGKETVQQPALIYIYEALI